MTFLKKSSAELGNFDVLIMGGERIINGEENPNRFRYDRLGINEPLVGRIFDVRENNIRINKNRLRLGGKEDTKFGLTEKQIPLTHTKAQDYLIKGRNPLLIIYFVHPSIEFDEEVYSSDKTVSEEARDAIKLYRELQTRKYKYLVGYALGFPQKDGASFKSTMYTVNKTVNYFDKDHENESVEE